MLRPSTLLEIFNFSHDSSTPNKSVHYYFNWEDEYSDTAICFYFYQEIIISVDMYVVGGIHLPLKLLKSECWCIRIRPLFELPGGGVFRLFYCVTGP
jgi:hypothetical protein